MFKHFSSTYVPVYIVVHDILMIQLILTIFGWLI